MTENTAPYAMAPYAITTLRRQVAEAMFGPTAKPSYKWHLLAFVSLDAMVAAGVANQIAKDMRTRYGFS
jgi:hypothetical protein